MVPLQFSYSHKLMYRYRCACRVNTSPAPSVPELNLRRDGNAEPVRGGSALPSLFLKFRLGRTDDEGEVFTRQLYAPLAEMKPDPITIDRQGAQQRA